MSVHMPEYSHELMEDVPHPCIFKGRCSHLKGGGDMEDRHSY